MGVSYPPKKKMDKEVGTENEGKKMDEEPWTEN